MTILGTPKGIQQTHNALLTSGYNHAKTSHITSNSRVLQFSAFTFDVYQIEICTTLTHGGCVCILSEYDRMNRLAPAMEEMRVNWAFFTPTFCRSIDPTSMPHLKTLAVGGEAVDKATIDQWVDHVLLLNMYGPAEVGPSVMCGITATHRPESIGFPVCVVCWIVDPDDHHTLSPVGAVGELLLEGYTMARGYLNEPEKTAASFIEPPRWLSKAGSSRAPRLYKTGDLVRYCGHGSIDYLGRKDTQVKVRGQRVELGEVEHHLRSHLPDSVDAAAEVVLLANSQGRKTLVAFICSLDQTASGQVRIIDENENEFLRLMLFSKDLRLRMETSVPASMVPAAVLPMSRMPTNTSGKLDRQLLKKLASQIPVDRLLHSAQPSNEQTVPQTGMEKQLQSLWERVLPNLDRAVFMEDNMIHLGADSITAMSLVAAAYSTSLFLTVEQIFKHPIFADMAQQLRPLEKHQEHVLQAFELLPQDKVAAIRSEAAKICRVHSERIEDIYPSTPLQEGILALSTLHPGSYVSQNIYEVPVALSMSRFRAAWDTAITQLSILRTRVIQTSYGVYQVVCRTAIDWQMNEESVEHLNADKICFMNNGDPMTRCALIAGIDGKSSRFVLTLHHCIYDAWSMDMLWKTVYKNYQGLKLAISPSFNTFIEHLMDSDADSSKIYWQGQLHNAPKTAFPDRRPGHSPLATTLVEHVRLCRLPPSSNLPNVTTSTLIRAAWSLIISQYCSVNDAILGVVTSGRTTPMRDIDRMVAPIIATVPVRVQIDQDSSIASFVERLHLQAAEMLPYEQTGLQKIKQYLDSEDQGSLDFQNLLVIQPTLDDQDAFPGVTCLSDGSNFMVPHALVMICSLDCQGVRLQASFDNGVLSEDTIRMIMSQFEHSLLQLVTANPNTKLKNIDMLAQQDREQVFAANATVTETMKECVHSIIDHRVKESPTSVAVRSWDGLMTYDELDKLSTMLSLYLRNLGARPGMIIPILFEKSKFAVVALLGVIKSGAAFVLIDYTTDTSRLKTVFITVKARAVLTSRTLKDRLKDFPQIEVVVIDQTHLQRFSTEACQSEAAMVSPSDVAYINFTSGTTSAVPKAVVIEHQAYSTAAMEHAKFMGIDSNSRVLQFASYNFDSAIVEILTALMHGACVCIPSEEDRMSNISGFMDEVAVSVAIFTPTVARASLQSNNLRSLRTLILVGESMSLDDVTKFKIPGLRLLSGYGLTECCVASSLFEIGEKGIGSLGKAIASNFWVTEPEDHDRLSPTGTIGELLIEGPILAREYLNDAERTATSFVASPIWSRGLRPMRLYKTGDLVRRQADGTLTLIGRRDTQKKLRGQRVDLQEVEGVIKRALGIVDVEVACDIITPNDHAGGSILGAFVCGSGSFERSPTLGCNNVDLDLAAQERLATELSRLRCQMLTELASHMIPSHLFSMRFIPLLSSGKIDRKKLVGRAATMTVQQLASFSIDAKAIKYEPSTEAEVVLARSWSKILGVPQEHIGADSSFFQFGDSIAAIRLTTLMREEGLSLAAADIISHPVLSEMAALIYGTDLRAEPSSVEPFALVGGFSDSLVQEVASLCNVQADAVQDVYPCTPLQEGLLALSVKSGGSYVAHNVLSLPPSLIIEAFVAAWDAVIHANPILRTRIVQTRSNGPLQVVMENNPSWFHGDDLAKYLEQEQASPPGFGDTLNRFATVSGPENNHFVWTSHHASYDGWSVDLIFRQVHQCYYGIKKESLLPYNFYVDYIQARRNDDADSFWQTQAEHGNPIPFPNLPAESYQPKPDTNLELAFKLKSGHHSVATMVHAAWALISARYVDTEDTVFGIVLSGRLSSNSGLEKVVGPLISTAPLRVAFRPDDQIDNLIGSIKDNTTQLTPYAHRGLQNIRKLSPQAEALCNFQTIIIIQPDAEMVLPCGTSSSPESSHDLSSFNNFGLMLEVKTKGHELLVSASFDHRLIESLVMKRLLNQFGHVLQQITVRTGATKICEIELATKEDMDELYQRQSSFPVAQDHCVHELLAGQTAKQNGKIAVQSWDGALTYRQLDDFSTRLANHLHSVAHVRVGNIVSLCFNRSMWTVVSVLAVLKAGGAVLLLDPTYPRARLQDIIQEAGTRVVLCDDEFVAKIEAKMIIEITPDFVESLEVAPSPDIQVSPHNKAFIFSTSGSTGKPKLMVHTHRAICTSIMGYGDALNLSENSRVLQFAAYSFDMSINEMLSALFHGGCLCVPKESDRVDDIARCINNMQVNWLFAVPSFIRHSRLAPENAPTLETLVVGGEATGQDIIDRWSAHTNLLGAFGPAETTVSAVGPLREPRNIGHPNGCNCWIVDPNNIDSLLPVGLTGELIMTGPVIAQGYLNASEVAFEIAPRWLTDEVRQTGGIYRTGDLVKYAAGRSLVYVGRIGDNQAKIAGQRLDLADVEYHVSSLLPDNISVTAAIANRNDHSSLLAFLSGSGKAEKLTNESIRPYIENIWSALYNVLPRYMVPKGFLCLDAVPLTTSGKLDRKGLQTMIVDAQALITEQSFEATNNAPLTEREELLKSLWTGVLNVEGQQISAGSSFFRLGGDSILAIRLVSVAREVDIHFSVADVFDNPTLRDMAKLHNVSTIEDDPVPFSMAPEVTQEILQKLAEQCNVDSDQIEDVYPCTPLQEGLFALSQEAGAYIARSVFSLPSDLDLLRFKLAWQEVINRNAILRTAIVQIPTHGLFQAVLQGSTSWEEHPSLEDYLERGHAMQLGDPLTSFAVVEDKYFVLTQHHASYDGHSIPRIFQQVEDFYHSHNSGFQSVPYSRFMKHVVNTDNRLSRDFWVEAMAGASPSPFPMMAQDYRPVPTSYRKFEVELGQASTGVTNSTLLRAAWALIVSSYTNSNDVTFGVTLSGRQAPVQNIEYITGPTISTCPLRVIIDPKARLDNFLRAMQRQAGKMIPHEQFGLQNIKKLGPESEAVCDFQNLLVVNPEPPTASSQESIHIPYAWNRQGDTTFRTFAMNIECTLLDKDRVTIEAFFDAELIDDIQMSRILCQLQHVLRQISHGGIEELADIECVSPRDMGEILLWNAWSPFPDQKYRVHGLIERQVQLWPTRPAVCSWDGDLTYQRLDELSSSLAYYLSHLGIRPESMVPLCFEKSLWMIVAVMAVIKAGGCFVPLDPSHPKQRLQDIIHQTKASLVLASSQYSSLFPNMVEVSEKSIARIATPAHYDWSCGIAQPDNALYVIFTSGSTGQPKGVVVEHQAFCSGSNARRDLLRLSEKSRVLQFSSYSFDVSVEDILSTLMAGACICVPSEEERLNDLARSMRRMEVTFANLTPSVAR